MSQSTVILTRPLRTPPAGRSLSGFRVLIVDPDEAAAAAIAAGLVAAGAQARVCAGAAAAKAEWPTFQAHALVIDPGADSSGGKDLAGWVREQPGGPLALLVTAGGVDDVAARALFAVGFDVHLPKPVDPPSLAALVAGYGFKHRAGDHGGV